MDEARKGDAALSASKYEDAIQHFTNAISSSPMAVKYYISRSIAYQRSTNYAEALKDAELAVVLAHKRAVRELIKDAQFRRAIALYFLEQYADADHLLRIVSKLDDKEKMLPIWTMKVAAKLKDMPADDEKRKVTIKDVPDVEISTAPSTSTSHSSKSENNETNKTNKTDTSAAPKAVVPTPADKIKHDWYQNNENVVFNVLAKGIPKDETTVEIEKDSLTVSFPVGGSKSEWSFTADPLFASIDPTQSKYRVTSNKVEVTLRKAKPGLKWHDLEGDRKVEADEEQKSTIPSHVVSGKSAQETPPAYPTSSKSGAKNWDKVVSEDLNEDDDIEGDETAHFFKKLYAGAGAEQQRAMLKSYQESGGTVLSTDWSNVGNRTVVPEPPEGMEAKKY